MHSSCHDAVAPQEGERQHKPVYFCCGPTAHQRVNAAVLVSLLELSASTATTVPHSMLAVKFYDVNASCLSQLCRLTLGC